MTKDLCPAKGETNERSGAGPWGLVFEDRFHRRFVRYACSLFDVLRAVRQRDRRPVIGVVPLEVRHPAEYLSL
jgi:hypothetical protein